ncbi:hypothetical protein [Saccharospirillum salsuginis]|uniref:Uncharacterized protein n=1 Tax=Saccharospirillum salsuginis TaxID=418750 RepID=A0A918N7T2_9GAMM|nr:hypothetical protein [Saccharospirillum salsuginis]GGX48580.1 hypothetical protein GCM10007392_14540 [Saccharospirillum salsuginis]
MSVRTLALILALLLAAGVQAESSAGHDMHDVGGHAGHQPASVARMVPTEPGQSAFATIQEIVGLLEADPETDWNRVDIERLRQHLIDMNNVTVAAHVDSERVDGGIRFRVTGDAPGVTDSIQRMVSSHLRSVGESTGDRYDLDATDEGVVLTLMTSDERREQRWAALGFIGWLSSGMHHQSHHLALARGQSPH